MNTTCSVPTCTNKRELYADGDHDAQSQWCAFHGETLEGQKEARSTSNVLGDEKFAKELLVRSMSGEFHGKAGLKIIPLIKFIHQTITTAIEKDREEVRGKAIWMPFDTAPKDREIIVVYPNQGDVFSLVKWNAIHGFWASKGEPQIGIENQGCKWTDIPELPTRLTKPQ